MNAEHAARYDIPNPRQNHYAAHMNYWFWLLIILIPIIVFSVKPQASLWRRTGRLMLAVGLAYIFINLALHLSIDRAWEAFNSCRFEHGGHDGPYEKSLARKLDEICPGAPNSGLPEVFYLVLGWIPAAAYVGFWEVIWRRRHRHAIRAMGKAFKGKWASNALIIFSVPVWLYLLVLLVFMAYMAGCNWLYPIGGHWFSPNDRCWLGQ